MSTLNSPLPPRAPSSGGTSRGGKRGQSPESDLYSFLKRPDSGSSQASGQSFVGHLSFSPVRPPSAHSLAKRRLRSFNQALLIDDRPSSGAGEPSSFFTAVVKPFLLMKGKLADDRRRVLVTWAADIASNCKVALPFSIQQILAARSAAPPAARTPEDVSVSGELLKPLNVADLGNIVGLRTVSSLERTTFLHVLTREGNVNDIILAPHLVDSTWLQGDGSEAVLPRLNEMQLLCRVALYCAGSLFRSMSEYDFRKKYSNKSFASNLGSDIDSTDEDDDDGAPRPLDVVLLTCGELLLANFERIGLHETSGEVKRFRDVTILEDLRKLINRLSLSEANAERTFGVLLGLTFSTVSVLANDSGILRGPLGVLTKSIEHQCRLYTMKADGQSLNKELMHMYEAETDAFYKIVRNLRLLVEAQREAHSSASSAGSRPPSASYRSINDEELDDDVDDDVSIVPATCADGDGHQSRTIELNQQLTERFSPRQWDDCLRAIERFIYYRVAEKHYHKDWIALFYAEMTGRERLMQFERDVYYQHLLYVKKTIPQHGTKEYLSGGKLWSVKEGEKNGREEILEQEAKKFAYIQRLVEARGVLSLENDPKKVANRLVPTTRAPQYAAVAPYQQSDIPMLLDDATRKGAPLHGKAAFYLDIKKSHEFFLDESGERLAIQQEAEDGWFVIALKVQLELELQKPSKKKAAARRNLDPSEDPDLEEELLKQVLKAQSTDKMKEVLKEAEDEHIAEEALLQRRIDARTLLLRESTMRRDVFVAEDFEREQNLFTAHKQIIVENRIRLEKMKDVKTVVAQHVCLLVEAEERLRVVLTAERELFIAERLMEESFMIIRTKTQHAMFNLSLQESIARNVLLFHEDRMFQSLTSMHALEVNLKRQVFLRTLNETEVKANETQERTIREQERVRLLMLAQREEILEEVMEIEAVCREQLHQSRLNWFWFNCVLGGPRNVLSNAVESESRGAIQTRQEHEFQTLIILPFLQQGILLLETELALVAHRLEDLDHEHPDCDGGDVEDPNDERPDTLHASTLRSEQRAELMTIQQGLLSQKGVLRYRFFQLDRSVTFTDTPSVIHKRHEEQRCGWTDGDEERGSGGSINQQPQQQFRLPSVPSPSVQRTRTFLRPLSAASSAAAAQRKAQHHSANSLTPTRPVTGQGPTTTVTTSLSYDGFSISAKMANFNRVWLSPKSKECGSQQQ